MHPRRQLPEQVVEAKEQAGAVQEEEPLAQVVAGAVPPGVLSVRVVPEVVWVAEAPWPPVVGARAAWQLKLA